VISFFSITCYWQWVQNGRGEQYRNNLKPFLWNFVRYTSIKLPHHTKFNCLRLRGLSIKLGLEVWLYQWQTKLSWSTSNLGNSHCISQEIWMQEGIVAYEHTSHPSMLLTNPLQVCGRFISSVSSCTNWGLWTSTIRTYYIPTSIMSPFVMSLLLLYPQTLGNGCAQLKPPSLLAHFLFMYHRFWH
jgi:hypothetical protein